MTTLLLEFYQAPGDTVTATAAVMSMLDQHPDVSVLVKGTATKETFEGFPRTQHYNGQQYHKHVRMDNPLINYAHMHSHVLHSYCVTLSKALGKEVKLAYQRPVIRLSDAERSWISRIHEIEGRSTPYFVVNLMGRKKCYTVKRYPTSRVQEVINKTFDYINWVQVGELGHDHPALEGVYDERGKTSHRQLIRLIAHKDCQGVLTGESLCHHIAAAFEKPCVTLCSSWLVPSWTAYPTAIQVSRMGCLPCCKTRGCGKSRVVALGDGDKKDSSLCTLPMVVDGEDVARCMDIPSDEIVSVIEQFRWGGVA